jgi:hypothetical protein
MSDFGWNLPATGGGSRRPGNPRRIVGIAVGLAVLLGIALLVLHFGPRAADALQPPRLTGGTCGIVVDRSSSSAPKGFDAGRVIDDQVPPFLDRTGCADAVFAPIDSNSRTSGCIADPVAIDPEVNGNVNREALWAKRRKDVVVNAHKVLDCTFRSTSAHGTTDVFGGLARIAQMRTGTGPFRVLVVSDFINSDPMVVLDPTHAATADVSSPAARQALIDKLVKADRVPSLRGIEIDTAGYGIALRGSPARFLAFDQFWHEYMRRAGCPSFRT